MMISIMMLMLLLFFVENKRNRWSGMLIHQIMMYSR